MRHHETRGARGFLIPGDDAVGVTSWDARLNETPGDKTWKDQPAIDDRALVAALVEQAADRSSMSRQQIAKAARLGRATLYRVLGGDPTVEQRTLRRIEQALSLPYDTLTFVAAHDWTMLSELLDPELLAWLQHRSDHNDVVG